ncbi:MAG TPA: AI-2E family transporter [Chitinophagales bacterium]|nr:AI-2E family transporter [Chitinophagales bacterium]
MTITASSAIKRLLLLVLIFTGLYFAKDFLMPLVIGALLATLYLPMCRWLEEKKVPRFIAVFLCLLTILLLASGVAALLGWQISGLMDDADKIKQKAIETGTSIQQYILTNLGIAKEKQMQLLKGQQSKMTGILTTILASTGYIFTSTLLMLVYFFLLLYYRSHVYQFILRLSAPEQRAETREIVYGATKVSQQYLVGLAKMIMCLWVMYGIGFSIAGVKNALFFAVLCGLLEIIPFIGNITGTSITLLVAAAQGGSAPMLLGIAGTYGLVQFIQGWVLEPIIVGPQVKINPLATILALVLGEMIWGIPGIILAIPVTAVLKIICDHVTPLKPYGFLIGEIEDSTKKVPWSKRVIEWIKTKLKRT